MNITFLFFVQLILYINKSTTYPYNYAMSPYVITAGNGMTIIPQRQFYTQYHTPYSDCNVLESDDELAVSSALVDRTLYEAVRSTGFAYAQKTCFAYCEQEATVNSCGCMQLKISYSLAAYNYCTSANETQCVNRVSELFARGDYVRSQCLSRCPLECAQRLLVPTITSSLYPSSIRYRLYLSNLTSLKTYFGDQIDFKSNMQYSCVQLLMYYDALAYVQVEEEPKMTAEDLLGILGGHLHLFLGMSLLSFVEIGEFVAIFFITLAKSDKVNDKDGYVTTKSKQFDVAERK